MKERAKEILSDYLLKLGTLGRKIFTVKELSDLAGETRQRVGWWLRQKGFEKLGKKRIGKAKITKYFLDSRALEVLKKKKPARMAFWCEHCNGVFYYDLHSDERFEPSSGFIIKKADPQNSKCCYCPECDRMDRRLSYSPYLSEDIDMAQIKREVVFSARPVKVDRSRAIVSGGPLFPKGASRFYPVPTAKELIDEFPETDENNNFCYRW